MILFCYQLREFDNSRGDIIHKYTNDERKKLKKMKLIPSVEVVNGKMEETDDIGFDYKNENNEEFTSDDENTDEEIEKFNYSIYENIL